jgi:hypothetical protein
MKDLVSADDQRERVRNCDETASRIDLAGMKTWTETGSQNTRHTLMDIRRIASQ